MQGIEPGFLNQKIGKVSVSTELLLASVFTQFRWVCNTLFSCKEAGENLVRQNVNNLVHPTKADFPFQKITYLP